MCFYVVYLDVGQGIMANRILLIVIIVYLTLTSAPVAAALKSYTQIIDGHFECEIELVDGVREIEINHCTLSDMKFRDN